MVDRVDRLLQERPRRRAEHERERATVAATVAQARNLHELEIERGLRRAQAKRLALAGFEIRHLQIRQRRHWALSFVAVQNRISSKLTHGGCSESTSPRWGEVGSRSAPCAPSDPGEGGRNYR